MLLSFFKKKLIEKDWFWVINSKRKLISFAIIVLTLFTYNAHEFFSYKVNYHNWFGYTHTVSYRNYYIFVANFFKYFNPILWCIAFYIYFYRETKAKIIFFIPISFCIARLLNVLSIKVDFNWYDELINFLIVFFFIRIVFYLSSKIGLKNKKIDNSDSLLNICENQVEQSYRKIEALKRLNLNGRIENKMYATYTSEELKKLKIKLNNILEVEKV